MPVIQQGSINLTSLIVPDTYVQIIQPSVVNLTGVPTDIIGIVGTAEWGDVNSIKTVANMADYSKYFGQILAEKHDAGTACALAVQQGAQNMRVVRVTDGTDTNASKAIVDGVATTGMTLTALYTGNVGNTIQVDIQEGSNSTVATPTYKVIITRPYYPSEVFDNIGGTGLELWQNMVDAINNGQNDLRGKSELVDAVIGTSTAVPALDTYTLTGGTNGNGSVDCSDLVGSDTAPRSGMYILRNSQCAVALLQGCDDNTTWANQTAFGNEEGIYMILVGSSGQYTNISSAVTAKKNAGIDSYEAKVLLGDWVWWNDTVNKITRLVSPQAVNAGAQVASGVQQSTLNKPVYGIVATEASKAGIVYTNAELTTLINAGLDVIVNPSPGGNYFSARSGHNSSSNIVIHGDNYTKMTNFLSKTLNSTMGQFLGETSPKPALSDIENALSNYLHSLKNDGIIDNYSVLCDTTNNPSDQLGLGYVRADVKVRYLGIVEFLIINLEGGSTVTITTESVTPAL